jgi:hypothetical protein
VLGSDVLDADLSSGQVEGDHRDVVTIAELRIDHVYVVLRGVRMDADISQVGFRALMSGSDSDLQPPTARRTTAEQTRVEALVIEVPPPACRAVSIHPWHAALASLLPRHHRPSTVARGR